MLLYKGVAKSTVETALPCNEREICRLSLEISTKTCKVLGLGVDSTTPGGTSYKVPGSDKGAKDPELLCSEPESAQTVA